MFFQLLTVCVVKVSTYLSSIIVWMESLVSELMGCAISRYSQSDAFLLGMAMNSPYSPSMTLMSWT
ncbi:MAG: hypothetical protein K2P27_08955, partial [Lachnospiraceae bacterium]|nr:hypothetical protein [Lachnospiraceae bacterium]